MLTLFHNKLGEYWPRKKHGGKTFSLNGYDDITNVGITQGLGYRLISVDTAVSA